MEKKNVPVAMRTTVFVSGFKIRKRDNPEDFKAVNSLFSAKFPSVMIELRRIAKGRAKGIKLAET
ncbi:hypothetical protein D3C85_1780930 [compost metagenome]